MNCDFFLVCLCVCVFDSWLIVQGILEGDMEEPGGQEPKLCHPIQGSEQAEGKPDGRGTHPTGERLQLRL